MTEYIHEADFLSIMSVTDWFWMLVLHSWHKLKNDCHKNSWSNIETGDLNLSNETVFQDQIKVWCKEQFFWDMGDLCGLKAEINYTDKQIKSAQNIKNVWYSPNGRIKVWS